MPISKLMWIKFVWVKFDDSKMFKQGLAEADESWFKLLKNLENISSNVHFFAIGSLNVPQTL